MGQMHGLLRKVDRDTQQKCRHAPERESIREKTDAQYRRRKAWRAIREGMYGPDENFDYGPDKELRGS